MQILGTSYLLLVLCSWASGRLSEETMRFVEEYFTHKFVRVITIFTCTKQGTNTLSKSSMIEGGAVSLLHPSELPKYGYVEMYSKTGFFRRLEMKIETMNKVSNAAIFREIPRHGGVSIILMLP